MIGKKNSESIVGLELGSGSIAATQLAGSAAGSATVERAEVGALAPGAFAEGEVVDIEALSSALGEFFSSSGLSKRVRLGVANQKLAVRVVRMPFVENPDEMAAAIRFKAHDEIPMPVDQAVLDHRIVAHSKTEDGSRQVDVIVVAARREMISRQLQALRGAGLKPAGIDLAAFGMIRALVDRTPPVANGEEPPPVPGTLYCGVGDGTNMAFARGKSCLFTRTASYGAEEIAADLGRRAEIPLDDARGWLVSIGLDRDLDELGLDEAQQELATRTRSVLDDGVRRLIDQIRPSIDFYAQQPGVPPMEQLVVSGVGGSIPGLPQRLAEGLGVTLRETRPAALSDRDPVTASRLATSYGLALEE